MKILFASDIHGSASAAEMVLKRFEEENCDRLILLGDLLYHGPRNDLPDRYDPKAVTAMLTEYPVTHGHLFNTECPPPHCAGDVLIHGHTHVHGVWPQGDYTYINPGSAALPKENQPKSYMVYEDGVFTIKELETMAVLKRWQVV